MFASHYIADAAVFPPRPPRDPFGFQPGEDKDAARKGGLIASLRSRLSSQRRGR